MNLQGQTKLELLRDGKVVHRVEKHNDVTGWINNMLVPGNMQWAVNGANFLPVSNWFNGCLLTEGTNDASLQMLAGDYKLVAQASNDAYTGSNLRRGSYNVNESGQVTGGYRFVWDWQTSQGNGDISSVCLTHSSFGAVDMNFSGSPYSDNPSNYRLGAYDAGNANGVTDLVNCEIVDYAKGLAYYITYDTSVTPKVIVIQEYVVSTSKLHIVGNRFGVNRLVATHRIPVDLQTNSWYWNNVSYTGNAMHFFDTVNNVTSNSARLIEYIIDTTEWTVTSRTHTWEGFRVFTRHYEYAPFLKDKYPIVGDYIWAIVHDANDSNYGRYIAKLSLTNDADVTLYDNPLYNYWSIGGDMYFYNGSSVILPNGDIYKLPVQGHASRNTGGLYCHNGQWNICRWTQGYTSWHSEQYQGNAYGTLVSLGRDYGRTDRNDFALHAAFPYVSTVNNLQNSVHKSADLTMKLTYTITES